MKYRSPRWLKPTITRNLTAGVLKGYIHGTFVPLIISVWTTQPISNYLKNYSAGHGIKLAALFPFVQCM